MTLNHVTWRREASLHGASRSPLRRWLDRRQQDRSDEHYASSLVNRFRATMWGAGLCEDTESCAGIPGSIVPQVMSVTLGEPDRLLVKMTPGQLLRDFTAVADRLAEGVGVPRVRIRPRPGVPGYIVVELLRYDPLAQPVMLPDSIECASQRVLFAGCDTGEQLSVSLLDVAHIIAQGQTRSGKSRWTYGLLVQLAGCRDVVIGGSDITGLIARAFDGTRHAPFWAGGSADLERHALALEEIVTEMDRRNAAMPRHVDVFPTSPQCPVIFCVIEELAGLLEAAAAQDAVTPKPRPGQKAPARLRDRIMRAYKRLMAEGAKAGVHVLLLVQRAEATIVGGFARGQASLRISFRVEDFESIKMLHSTVDRPTAEAHSVAESGIALVSGPGLPLMRVRSPHMPSYAAFVDLVQQACTVPALPVGDTES